MPTMLRPLSSHYTINPLTNLKLDLSEMRWRRRRRKLNINTKGGPCAFLPHTLGFRSWRQISLRAEVPGVFPSLPQAPVVPQKASIPILNEGRRSLLPLAIVLMDPPPLLEMEMRLQHRNGTESTQNAKEN